ncbi:MAG: transglutaminase family protein [Pseudonocardiales bacterium]|nr:transglutaminase family protein [Pseudonocardiales bacterium]
MHSTKYEYDDEVTTSFGRAHLIPHDGDGQTCVETSLEIDPPPLDVSDHTDYFGNVSTYFCVLRPHTVLTVTSRSEVKVDRRPAAWELLAGRTWEDVRDSPDVPAAIAEYRLPSPRLTPDAEVDAYARTIFTPGRPFAETLVGLYERIYADFEYKFGVTTVRTTLPQLLEKRQGVCQDFAHLAIGCLRSVGLPARYVSGYLETYPPPGKPKLQGSDASHAWGSVYVDALGWVDFDPTNNQMVDDRYLIAAHGRDYSDVPPLKGVIVTDSKKSTLDVSVDVTRLPEH